MVLGNFTNYGILRSNIEPSLTFRQLLERTVTQHSAAWVHQETPYEYGRSHCSLSHICHGLSMVAAMVYIMPMAAAMVYILRAICWSWGHGL